MALTLGTNSYSTVAEADLYFEDNLQYSNWSALDADTKSRALITASGQISIFVSDEYKLPIDAADITAELKAATNELGLYLALNPDSVTQGSTGSNTKRVKAGSAEVEYFKAQDGDRFPAHVMAILREGDLIGGSSSSAVGAEAFGTCEQSHFTDDQNYDRGAFS